MLVQIELVAPVAVCYQPTTPARTTTRAIFCDSQKIAPEKQLSDFFLGQTNDPPRKPQPFVWLNSDDSRHWEQHPQYPELTLGPRAFPNDAALVFCQIQQEHTVLDSQELERYRRENLPAPWVSFLFTSTAQPNDVWRVWADDKEVTRLAISSWGQEFVGLENGGLQPSPDEPYLPFYATDTLTLDRWQNQPLPFRVKVVPSP